MNYLTGLFIIGLFFIFPVTVFAHVVVSPKEVGIGKFQTFSVGVPVEKEMATTAVRLILPEGLVHVTPNVKPGWQIEVMKDGEDAVTEIKWSGGRIPAGQRDDFLFSAQVPAAEKTLVWKAYQTYEDGTVVAWDQQPGGADHGGANPYSETKVINDLVSGSDIATEGNTTTENKWSNHLPLMLSVVAILLATGSFALQFRKNNLIQ